MTYNEYVPLLLSAAAQYDSQFASNQGSKAAARRQTYVHKLSDPYEAYEAYNINTGNL